MQRELELTHHPVYGGIFRTTVFEGDAVLERDRFVYPGIEAEIIVRLGRDLPLSGAPYDRTTVAGAVGASIAGFEVIDSR
jgi:2-keto-4-pentenoate hydratase